MNILIFSWRGPGHPNAGGAEISTHEHAKGWIKAGHNVTLFTSSFPGARQEEIIDGVKIIRRGSQIFGVQISAIKWYLFNRHLKFDLIIDQFHGIPFFTPLYVREKKIGFIHEVTKEVWRFNPWPKPFNLVPYAIGTLFEPLVFNILYKKIPFMTVSNSTKKDLEDWGIEEKNIFIVHNGVTNKPLKGPQPKEEKTTITYLGAVTKDKGIEDALKVFSLLKLKNNDFQFWVIGKSDEGYLSYLNRQVKRLGIEENIKFWGYVSEDKKNVLLARSYLLINPSIREGWGLSVIEAARMGTPSIGYNVGGLKDSIIDNRTGILTQKNTPEEMAESVIRLVGNQVKYMRMCQQAKQWSNKFSWANSVKQSLSLLKEVYGRYNFLFFALAATGSGISGGDRIFIELVRRWSMQENVTIYMTEEGKEMCKRQNLSGNKLLIHTVGNSIFLKNFFVGYFYRIFQGIKLGLKLKINENTYVYSASDFWMDVVPAFFIKLRSKKVKWIASWYQTAPNPLTGYGSFFYWISQLFIKPLIKKSADLVLVNNNDERKQFPNLDRQGRVGVVLGAVNLTNIKKWIKSRIKKKKIYDAVFQGRFHPQKGVVELIDIWKLVVKKRPNATLAMIGDGPLMEQVKKRIYDNSLNQNVKLFGYVFDGSLKYEIFAKSKLVVHPAFYDSGGMAAAEAMAFGIPCIGFNLKSYDSYYPKGMVKVEIGNLDVFAETVVNLLNDEERLKRIGHEAVRMIESSWSWDKRSEEIFKFITQNG